METRAIIIIFISFILLSVGSCKKDNRKEPPKVVSYQISKIIGSNTHLTYSYDTSGVLIRVDGKDRDKSLTCDISYDKEKVFLDYHNRTANERWNITVTVDPNSGYIQTYDDGLYLVTFVYDSTRFEDKVNRLVGSYYHGGRHAGDSLCYQMQYDPLGNLLSCMHRGENRQFEYDLSDTVQSNITTFYTDAVLGRIDRVISFLPYSLGPSQKYLVKTLIKSYAFYTNYQYDIDEFGRISKVYENAAGTDYYYLE